MKINDASAAHVAPVPNGTAEWRRYDNSLAIQRGLLVIAISFIQVFIQGRQSCDDKFKTLPGGRSFSDIMNDDSVWISYCPDPGTYGYTNAVGGKDITICQQAFSAGVQTVMGTLIHEMAHVNGADAATHAAESTLPPCFMSSVYDATIVGSRKIFRSTWVNELSAKRVYPRIQIQQGGKLMVKKAIAAKLVAKPGKEAEVEALLTSALSLANQEPLTVNWYAVKFNENTFGIFDTFASDEGRDAHLNGQIAAALMAKADELLAEPPQIDKVDVLAAKQSAGQAGSTTP